MKKYGSTNGYIAPHWSPSYPQILSWCQTHRVTTIVFFHHFQSLFLLLLPAQTAICQWVEIVVPRKQTEVAVSFGIVVKARQICKEYPHNINYHRRIHCVYINIHHVFIYIGLKDNI